MKHLIFFSFLCVIYLSLFEHLLILHHFAIVLFSVFACLLVYRLSVLHVFFLLLFFLSPYFLSTYLSNTCFFNSVMQSLAGTIPFVQLFRASDSTFFITQYSASRPFAAALQAFLFAMHTQGSGSGKSKNETAYTPGQMLQEVKRM